MADTCRHGHDTSSDDLVYIIRGTRRCKICQRASIERSRVRKMAERSHKEELVTASERAAFWDKTEMVGACIIWKGARNNIGYGIVTIAGRNSLAHRVSYRQDKGSIPEGLVIDHLCRTPLCVNPDHLEAVTQCENLSRGRIARGYAA